MFPVSDFNFVVAGIATFAATVGYACSRRLSINFLDIPDSSVPTAPTDLALKETNMEVRDQDQERDPAGEVVQDSPNASSQSRRNSLKRKVPHDGFDEPSPQDLGYPHNLVNIYPNKRSRTPSTDSDKDDAPAEAPKAEYSTMSLAAMISDEDVVIPSVSEDPEPIVATPASEPPRTPSPSLEESTPKAPPPAPASPALPSRLLPATRPTTPQPSASFGSPNPSRGFAAFAGSTSPFASLNKSQSPLKNSQSIWNANFEEEPSDASSSRLPDISKPSALRVAPKKHAIAAVEPASKPATFTHITGEENEDVELELKGVKLYVKRGNRPFSDGMVGHIKLLSDKETLEERLLFRREPLWKISMNIRVKPTVRCTFDAEEGVVRLVLKESVGSQEAGSEAQSGAKESTQEVVVYALKPGRSCSKQDFKEFAESLLQSSHFKPPKTAMST